ncbi:hypothetical protein KM043_004278 [Ampulex compressa]|nr:hypothetical protein KM043_004278 [Ampulex compressa]
MPYDNQEGFSWLNGVVYIEMRLVRMEGSLALRRITSQSDDAPLPSPSANPQRAKFMIATVERPSFYKPLYLSQPPSAPGLADFMAEREPGSVCSSLASNHGAWDAKTRFVETRIKGSWIAPV